MLVSFVIPCLNESKTIVDVIKECHLSGEILKSYEIIVADNGSRDNSQELSKLNGAKVVYAENKGYGAALKEGIKYAKGKYVIMGDGDKTYDFSKTYHLIRILENGYDLVIGNRFKGNIQKDAMPPLHFYFGNPILSALGRMFFGIEIGDFHCGLRGFRRESILKLNLESDGMEFASEMIIKASLLGLKMTEVATNLRKSPPGRVSNLRTWRDGWRHLKYMLSFAPEFSLLPFAVIFATIAFALIVFYTNQFSIFGGTNTLLISLSCFILSFNISSDYLLSKEIIFQRYQKNISYKFDFLTLILGLKKGTDRLFKLSFISILVSVFFGLRFHQNFIKGTLSSMNASINGFVFSLMLVLSITLYLTATKINIFRTFYPNKIKYDKS